MANSFKCRLFIVFGFFSVSLFAQDRIKFDSLQLLLQHAKVDTTRINVLLELARLYQPHSYPIAVDYARNARDLAAQSKLKRWEAKSNRMLALILFNMGDYKNATATYLNTLRYYEEVLDTNGIMAVNNNLGVVYDRLKDYDQALVYYLKAQQLHNSLKSQQGSSFPLPSLYNNIANIYQTKGDFESALQYYNKSLSLARESGSKAVEGVALNNIGKLYFVDLKKPETALEYLLKGLNVREENGDKAEIAKSLVFLIGYFNQQRNFEEGKQYAERAITLGKEIGSLEVQLSAFSSLADAEEGLNRFKESLEAFKNFKKINDSIQSKSTASEITRLRLQYDFEKAEQLQKQEQNQSRIRYLATIILMGICLLVAILIVIIIRTKARQTELKRKNLAQDVENKNKELTTNVMYLIRKNQLLNNVAERLLDIQPHIHPDNRKVLHDIILDLQSEADQDSWKEFELRFNQVHNDFYKKLRQRYPDLSPAEEKLCAFLRLNMSSKEIAVITQQSIKSVEVARARLRKKLDLTNTQLNLVIHLANL